MSALILKLIAAVSMAVDHMGLMLFPRAEILRYIGRLAFPIYAFFISEGYRHTHDRVKYFLRVFLLGVLCQIVYTVAEDELYIGILLTFSFSIAIMACFSLFKRTVAKTDEVVLDKAGRTVGQVLAALLCVVSVGAAYFVSANITVDYGFSGIMLPVLCSVTDNKPVRLALFSVGLAAVALEYAFLSGTFVAADFIKQACALAAVPLLWLYNGTRGKYRLKYFFYIFYPAHLALLYLISVVIH